MGTCASIRREFPLWIGESEYIKNGCKVDQRKGGNVALLDMPWLSKFRTMPGNERDLTPLSDSRVSPTGGFTIALEDQDSGVRTIVKWLGGEDEIDCEGKLSLYSTLS